MFPSALATSTAAFVLAFALNANGQDHQHAADEKLGMVAFATSCSAAAQPQFNRAVALLHSFEFLRAIEAFGATLKTDPSCAMAEWGIAVSRWSNPFAAGIRPAGPLQQGRDAVARARTIGLKTDRERAYVEAVSRLFASDTTDQTARVLAYRDAMAKVAAAHPDDREASIFYALAIAAAASPSDMTFADQLKAGAILEGLIARQPDHPGLAHYIIHSYDFPPLADRALVAARRYAKLAPSAPHALHMPSHTFTRLGYWQDSIDTNTLSGAAAKRDGSVAEELHTMDYRIYAYLQTAQDRAARQILDALPEVTARFDPNAIGSAAPGSAGVFALAAIPARYALERGAWAEAATLQPHPSKFPYAEALTYFARAIGAARTGNTAIVRSAIEALQTIEQQLTAAQERYWAGQTEIQRLGASAWLAFAERREADALTAMRAAAALEDRTEKSAVTPGPLAPARELLGELLLEFKHPGEARTEFEATLKTEPNRFRALYGAARAASLAGDRAAARRYYDQLLTICERADKPDRSELAEARQGPAAPSDFAAFLVTVDQAQLELQNGRPAAFKGLWSQADDVTLSGGLGGTIEKGWKAVSSRLDWVGTQFSNGTSRIERLVSYAGTDLGYVIQAEHLRYRVPGQASDSTREYRVTMIFRREAGAWRLVHRQADSQTVKQP